MTTSAGPGGEHALDIAGEGKQPGEDEILIIAKKVGVDEKIAKRCLDEIKAAMHQWPRFAEESGVSTAMARMIGQEIGV